MSGGLFGVIPWQCKVLPQTSHGSCFNGPPEHRGKENKYTRKSGPKSQCRTKGIEHVRSFPSAKWARKDNFYNLWCFSLSWPARSSGILPLFLSLFPVPLFATFQPKPFSVFLYFCLRPHVILSRTRDYFVFPNERRFRCLGPNVHLGLKFIGSRMYIVLYPVKSFALKLRPLCDARASPGIAKQSRNKGQTLSREGENWKLHSTRKSCVLHFPSFAKLFSSLFLFLFSHIFTWLKKKANFATKGRRRWKKVGGKNLTC